MQITSNLPVPESRPLLIYNHNAKAGGGSIIQLLKDAKKCKIWGSGEFKKKLKARHHTHKRHHHNHHQSHDEVEDLEEDLWREDCFVEIREGSHTSYHDRQEGFIIGSIREPCSHYVSFFTFTSDHHGYLWSWAQKNHGLMHLLGEDAPLYNSTRDKAKFQKFLYHGKVHGRVHKHLGMSYIDDGRLEVDCWVYVDDFQVSLYECLRMYEEQGGWINWNAPMTSALKTEATKQMEERTRFLGEHTKNDPIGNPQQMHHAPCNTYFDEKNMRMIEKEDVLVYKTFGYEGCCKGRKNIYYETISHDLKKKKKLKKGKIGDTAGVDAPIIEMEPHSIPTTNQSMAILTSQQQGEKSSIHSFYMSITSTTRHHDWINNGENMSLMTAFGILALVFLSIAISWILKRRIVRRAEEYSRVVDGSLDEEENFSDNIGSEALDS